MITDKRTRELWDCLQNAIQKFPSQKVTVMDMARMATAITNDQTEIFLLGSMAGTIAFAKGLGQIVKEEADAEDKTIN